jgi:hypothetical protein
MARLSESSPLQPKKQEEVATYSSETESSEEQKQEQSSFCKYAKYIGIVAAVYFVINVILYFLGYRLLIPTFGLF